MSQKRCDTFACNTSDIKPSDSVRKQYSIATADRVIRAFSEMQAIEDVVTITALSRRTGVSRATVRAVLRHHCGWTPAQSYQAHRAGVGRGKLLQSVAGHPGLAKGRETLQSKGWPNLRRAHQTLKASEYEALKRGRVTQSSNGWIGLIAGNTKLASIGYPNLAQGRANLAARGWPNWKRAQDALREQDYLPLVEAQRMRAHTNSYRSPRDRRAARGRSTRLAILEALRTLANDGAHLDMSRPGERRVTRRELATKLHLHPTTIYIHLKHLRAEGIVRARGV